MSTGQTIHFVIYAVILALFLYYITFYYSIEYIKVCFVDEPIERPCIENKNNFIGGLKKYNAIHQKRLCYFMH